MYMRPERAPVPSVLEAIAPRTHALQGPGAMAAETATVTPPRLAARTPWSARIVLIVCLLGTLWLGLGPNLGLVPGLSRVLAWAETAVESAH
jgi:hypothetical protein